MVIRREPHTIAGRFYGMFYHFDSGKVIYMAHRSGAGTKGYFRNSNSWCLDKATLSNCLDRGVTAAGVIWRHGKNIFYYLTNIEDFFDPPSTNHMGDRPQRSLCREFFRVRMARDKTGLVPISRKLIGVR